MKFVYLWLNEEWKRLPVGIVDDKIYIPKLTAGIKGEKYQKMKDNLLNAFEILWSCG